MMSIRKSNKLHTNPKRFISTCNNNLTATAIAAALADIGGTFQSFVDKDNYHLYQLANLRRCLNVSDYNRHNTSFNIITRSKLLLSLKNDHSNHQFKCSSKQLHHLHNT